MNKKTTITVAVLAALAAVLVVAVVSQANSAEHRGPGQFGRMQQQMSGGHGRGSGMSIGANGSVTLTKADRAGLQYMVEEEKLAHDVYTALAKRYPGTPFATIAQSELRHEAAVRRQLARAGVTDPTAARASGVFVNRELQRLHDSLINRGASSRAAALRIGALIERTDVADLKARSAATTDAVIRRVYSHLERASGQHLRIFDAQLGVADASSVVR